MFVLYMELSERNKNGYSRPITFNSESEAWKMCDKLSHKWFKTGELIPASALVREEETFQDWKPFHLYFVLSKEVDYDSVERKFKTELEAMDAYGDYLRELDKTKEVHPYSFLIKSTGRIQKFQST